MKCYGISMVHSTLGLLSLLACAVRSSAVRYGDYSVAHMPQYEERGQAAHGDEFVVGADDYNDKSLYAPARLDYKYEEERHEKSDDGAIKDIDEESELDKPRTKTRIPLVSHNYPNLKLDENSFEDAETKNQEIDRLSKRRSRFRNSDFESDKRLKHKSMDWNEDLDNIEDKNYYIQKDNIQRVGRIDEFEDFSHPRHRYATQKKVRRKPRDRALHQPKRTRGLDEEEFDALRDRDQYFGCTSARGVVRTSDHLKIRKPIKQVHDYDYGEFYDMKRVHNLKDRLPALLRQKTVRTTWPQNFRYFENRKQYEQYDAPPVEETTESNPAITMLSVALKTSPSPHITLNDSMATTTTKLKPGPVNISELSLAEKSRLSILKKALINRSGGIASKYTKPPVLMQVTRQMQTMVVVERQPAALAGGDGGDGGGGDGGGWAESPARLERARRLMRRKLVAAARSLHDLTDNWDQMVCDYIDVSLLDADCATSIRLHFFVAIVCALPFFLDLSWH